MVLGITIIQLSSSNPFQPWLKVGSKDQNQAKKRKLYFFISGVWRDWHPGPALHVRPALPGRRPGPRMQGRRLRGWGPWPGAPGVSPTQRSIHHPTLPHRHWLPKHQGDRKIYSLDKKFPPPAFPFSLVRYDHNKILRWWLDSLESDIKYKVYCWLWG